ncbi:hypothetical protein NL108_014019 [Boleophthalmus pectinirostris]|nr:hypothetical protein NL108_014019 [Boleophthalmus pectinirostris]
MDCVLEGATVLSICKLVCSLPFVQSMVTSTTSPFSFCSICLLIFTDVILTVFFSCLLVLEHFQIIMPFTGDYIALRCLLFICHTYGTVFLLTLPEIIVDTFIRHLAEKETKEQQNSMQNNAAECSDKTGKKPTLLYYITAYIFCLSIWIFVALNTRLKFNLEEMWAEACLYTTKSLFTCLPNIHSPMMRVLPPYWIMVLLYFSIALAVCSFLLWRKYTELATPDVDTSEAQCTCTIQMYDKRDVGLSPECTVKNTEKQDHNSTEKVVHLELPEERKVQNGSSPRTDLMIGVVCILAMFVLPLYFTVNIHLIILLDKTTERSIKYFGFSRCVTVHNHMDTI